MASLSEEMNYGAMGGYHGGGGGGDAAPSRFREDHDDRM